MNKKLKIKDLTPDDKNFNKGSEFGNSLIEKSFRKFGAGRSILIDKNNRIIAGNKSIENAAAIGMDDIEVIESDGTKIIAVKRTDIDLDSEIGREMALADNASAKANIVFDAELIEAEIGEATAIEWGIELEKQILNVEEDDFLSPEGGIETDIVLGDLFEIGEHRLLCGDSTDSDQVAKLMNGQKADMVFTDPPYGVDYQGGALTKRTKLDNDQKNTNIYSDVLPNIILFTKDKAPIYIWHAAGYADMASHLWDNDIEIRSQIIWNKNIAQFGALSAQYKQKHEPCFYCFKKGNSPHWYGPTNEVTVWDVKRESKNEYHPTQKPIELPSRALNNSSKIGDYIIDFFLGSGSTMVASHQLKRKCYGMELDPKYCQVIVDRMIKLDSTLQIKKNGIKYENKQKSL